MKTLSTIPEVIAALGGPVRLAEKLGISKQTVSGWQRPGWTITTKYRDVMAAMLADLEPPCTAPAALWGMVEPKKLTRKRYPRRLSATA